MPVLVLLGVDVDVLVLDNEDDDDDVLLVLLVTVVVVVVVVVSSTRIEATSVLDKGNTVSGAPLICVYRM